MQKKVLHFLQQLPLKKGDLILCAVSGGGDSMAMLLLLAQLSRESHQNPFGELPPFSLAVAHFDHESRGGASSRDALFVRKYVENLLGECSIFHKTGQTIGIDPFFSHAPTLEEGFVSQPNFFLESAPVAALAQERKQGFEQTARELRYGFLEKTADSIHADFIATAHHGQDNLESFLLNLCRGSGLGGLSSIAPQQGRLIRPLLTVTPEEISGFLAENAVPSRFDQSNLDENFRRNYLRHQVLPHLREINPKVIAHSVNTIRIIREENNFLSQLVQERFPITVTEQRAEAKLEDFRLLPEALESRAIEQLVQRVSPKQSLSMAQRTQALHLIKRNQPFGEILLKPLLRLGRSYDTIFCELTFPEEVETCPPTSFLLSEDSRFHWGRWSFRFQLHKEAWIGDNSCKGRLFCQEVSRIHLRNRAVGDRLRLAGRVEKTLKKWFIDEKIPQKQRDCLPILCHEDGRIIAVPVLGVAEEFLPLLGENFYEITVSNRGDGAERQASPQI